VRVSRKQYLFQVSGFKFPRSEFGDRSGFRFFDSNRAACPELASGGSAQRFSEPYIRISPSGVKLSQRRSDYFYRQKAQQVKAKLSKECHFYHDLILLATIAD
jgi:hypothetical protein